MKHGRYSTIEGRQELPGERVIVDVRTTGQRIKDWVMFPRNFAKAMSALGIASLIAPIFLPFLLFALLAFVDEYAKAQQYLPMRYPAWCKERDPGLLHPGTDKPELPTGIMYFGVVDARDPYERGKQVFLSADDLTRHMLVLGTTGSGKSEFLKGMTFNVLCWASGFFVADAKADNKLPTDMYSQVRMFARDYDFLVVNYLLGGLTPAQIANMRERLSNGLQPTTTADADTITQMTSNILVKASGDSKTWQDRGLNMYRGVCRAATHKRDIGELTLSFEVLREYLSLDKIGELYVEGYKLADGGPWPLPYLGVKSYLEVGLPGFQVTNLLRKHGCLKDEEEDEAAGAMAQVAVAFGKPPAQQKKPPTNQTNEVYNQHGYRADQVFPALSLLIDTYGHIFKRKHAEVDMQDVVVNNRICVSLIPSLEKGSQEQESLGKLNLALLRVMMARALGSSIEGDVHENVDAKITASNTPFALFLDEFAYQFAEGIALTAAQARSLNFFLCALAQDLEKLTEGDRAAEAGAMMANQAAKFFMKIIGSDKTHDLAQKTLGEAEVAVVAGFELETGSMTGNVKRETAYRIEKRPRIGRKTLEELASGFATFAYRERAHVMRTFYPSPEVPRVRYPRINRFLQIHDLGETTMLTSTVELQPNQDKWVIQKIRGLIESGQPPSYAELVTSDVIQSISRAAKDMNPHTPAIERGIVLFEAGVQALHHARTGESLLGGAGAAKGQRDAANAPQAPAIAQEAAPAASASASASGSGGQDAANAVPSIAAATAFAGAGEAIPDSAGSAFGGDDDLDFGLGEPQDDALLAEAEQTDPLLSGFDPLSEIMRVAPPIARKPKDQVFGSELSASAPQEPAAHDNAFAETESIPAIERIEPTDDPQFDPATELAGSHWDDDVALITDEPAPGEPENLQQVAIGATTAGVVAVDQTTLPVQAQSEARAGLQELSRTTVDSALIERMGPEVIGLREAAKEELVNLEVTLGATPEQASDAAANTEKAVAKGLSLLDNNKTNTSATDFEILFSELTNLVDNT